MIEPKDVVGAILGASAALAGFVLVFLGIVIASYQSYSGTTPAPVVRPYRLMGATMLGTFALSLLTTAISLLWLASGEPAGLYGWAVGLFVLQLVAVLVSSAWATRIVLWQ